MNSQSSTREDSEDVPLVTLCRYSYLHEALLARELLEAEGVPAFVPDENAVSLNWGSPSAFGGVRLEVREDDAERAAEILQLTPEDLRSHEET